MLHLLFTIVTLSLNVAKRIFYHNIRKIQSQHLKWRRQKKSEKCVKENLSYSVFLTIPGMILHWYLTGTADGRCYTPIKLMLEQIAPSFTLYDIQAVAGIREALASPFSWWGRRELGVINEEHGGCWRRVIAAKARLKGLVRWDQQWIDLCLGADRERGREHMLPQQVLDQFVEQEMVDWRASAAGENEGE